MGSTSGIHQGLIDPRRNLRRVKVLFVATRPPFPPWRGDQLRAYHLLRHLARRHEVTLVVAGSHPSGSALAAVAALGVQVRSLGSPRAMAPVRMARGLVGDRRPFQVLPYSGRAVVRELGVLAATHDVVHGHLVRSLPMVPPDGPLVLDLIDAPSLNMRRRAEREGGIGARLARWEAARLARYEQVGIARADTTIVAAPDDAGYLGGRPVVIPNGVDLGEFWFRDAPRAHPVIGFAGNLGYFPNVDAVRTIVGKVLPAIRHDIPEARAIVTGAHPARAVRRLAGADVAVVADPPDIGALIASVAVAVIPMRAGTGIQNKVLEAMAVGTPVVTTERVAAGVGAVDGMHLLVAEGPQATAAVVVRLLGDGELAARLRRAGRALVEENFTWERAAAAVERLWMAAAG